MAIRTLVFSPEQFKQAGAVTAFYIDDNRQPQHYRYTEILAPDTQSLFPDAKTVAHVDPEGLIHTSYADEQVDPTSSYLLAKHATGQLTTDDLEHHIRQRAKRREALANPALADHREDFERGGRA